MLIWGSAPHKIMASRVVSTKLTEEEYGKLVGLCSSSGFTVSKLLKRAILKRMNEELPKAEQQLQTPRREEPKSSENKKMQKPARINEEEKFLYY